MREELRKKALQLERLAASERKQMYFCKTLAWLGYLGLLRQNYVENKRAKVTLAEALQAARLEPRIYELLPAILVRIPNALDFEQKDLPQDLAAVVKAIKERRALADYKGVPPEKYIHWLNADIVDIASRRLSFREMPRRRQTPTGDIGQFVREHRLKLALTQHALAQQIDVSVRVVRDLEQGRLSTSLYNAMKVLGAFSAKLSVS